MALQEEVLKDMDTVRETVCGMCKGKDIRTPRTAVLCRRPDRGQWCRLCVKHGWGAYGKYI